MEIIKSLENKRIKRLSKLLIKKYRDEADVFLVEGEHLVEEAYKTNTLVEIFQTEDFSLEYNVPTTLVSAFVLKKLCSSVTPQKVVGVVKKLEEKEIGNKILILDDIQDPGNLGTIIRSSVAFGVDTIVVSPKTVDIYNDKVIRASDGMLFYSNIIKRDIISFIQEIHKKGYQILGTKVTGGENVKTIVCLSSFALVMGNEGAGVKEEILSHCDKYLYIPMASTCESLNVGVATSILLYELNNK